MKIIASDKSIGVKCILLFEESKTKDFDASEFSHMFVVDKEKKLLIGLGKKKDIDDEKVRRIGSSISDICRYHKQEKISIEFEMMSKYSKPLAEGMILSNYRFEKYKKEKGKSLKEVVMINSKSDVISKTKKICDNINFLRDVINDSPSIMNTDEMEKISKKVAKEAKLKLTILNHSMLKKKKLNLIDAVGKGANCPPRLVIMEYNNNPKAKKIALIGKGITFDSGGINLKPSGYIEDMKCDKTGALTVMAVMKTVSELKMKVNVVGVMPFCENMIGPDSYKPGDFFIGYDGTTVEIGNTDAEGRMVLGDAISYTLKNYKPDTIIDFATLTGSAAGTFGDFVSALFTNDKNLGKKIFDSGERTFERVWELPLYEEYEKEIEPSFSDLTNSSPIRYFGAIEGALFLKKFAKKCKWAHIDMAGTAFYDKKRWYSGKGSTGWGVRLILDFLENN